LLIGIYCFLRLIGVQTRVVTRKTNRRAEDLYDGFADSPRKQRRYAKEHGDGWTDADADTAASRDSSPHSRSDSRR
jgi:hypothetical protein